MIKIKNAVNGKSLSILKDIVLFPEFPWFFMNSTAYSEKTVENDSSFSHILFSEKYRSPFFDFFHATFLHVFENSNISFNEIFRMRLGLIPRTDLPHEHLPHVDFYEPHGTALFCLSGDSGETTFYNQKYNGNINEEFSICEKVKPVENQIIFFDGLQFHSSTTPVTDTPRVMLNINYR